MQTRIRLIVVILLLASLVGQILAQEDTFTGDIDNDRDTDEHVIRLEEGDGVIITAIAPSGSDLDTVLTLVNGDGDEVAMNDDFEFPDSTNSRIAYVAEDDGKYVIVIGNYPGSDGDYEITVEYVSAEEAEDMMDDSDDSGSVSSLDLEDIIGAPDLEFDGSLDDGDEDEYTIDLEEGQGVVIIAEASSGSDIDTYLSLLNEDGDEVAVNDDAIPGEVFDSQIVYIAEEDGEYTIIMSNYPGFDGDYDLTVTFVTEEEAEEVNANSEVEPEVDTTPERDPDEEYTGELDEGDEDEYTIELNEGDGLIAAVYETDGFMDTVISVIDPEGVEIARNDDRGDYSTLDSQVGLIAQQSGDYTVIVSHYPDSPGEYLLEIYYATPEEASLAEQAIRLLLSGPVERFETENFVIHYTLEGVDATDEDYVELVAEVVEEVYAYQIEELGWVQPPSDILQGGDGRYDVYLANLDDIYGYVTSSSQEGDNPNTSVEETFAQAGFMVLDNDYADDSDPERALLATTAHEFHHIVQFGYDSGDMNWYYESTASWMETVTYPDDELATIYVPDVYQYPEVCFGEEGGIYGTWLFFEFMSRELGDDAPFLLWDNIVLEDGFEPLEMTLDEYDETIPSFIAQYHINNLVRDYEFIDGFGNETVWLESIIDDEGDWEPEGDGVQELGANFFYLDVSGDVYEITIDDDDLEIYVIGIEDDEGFVYSIGDSGVVDTDDFDETYIMVFNPDYDDDVSDCDYVNYELTVEETSDDEDDISFEVDAENFRDLEN